MIILYLLRFYYYTVSKICCVKVWFIIYCFLQYIIIGIRSIKVMRKKWRYQTLVRGALALRVSGFNASTTVQQTIASTNIIDKINPSKLLRCIIWISMNYGVRENFGKQTLLVWGLFHNKFQGRITYPYDKAFTVQTIWTCRLFWNLVVIVFSLIVGYIYLKEYRLVQYSLRALASVGIHNYKEKGL